MPPVAMRLNRRSQRKKALPCAVSVARSRPSRRMTSRVQVSRLVHSGHRSLTTNGPLTESEAGRRSGSSRRRIGFTGFLVIRKKLPYDSKVTRAICLALVMTGCAGAALPPYLDRTHPSVVLGGARNYRIFLPTDYEQSKTAYPVIYYFHGHSDRYTLERYDQGKDTVPRIAAFVATHPVIVVAVDGYLARDYTGFYGGTPWDVRAEGGQFDFGQYFLELTAHIDATYRTLPTRRHRATSGLSMGGFMSLFLSARYPDWIGSASAFNPGPEFYAGEPGRRNLWRPKDHVSNHAASMIRLVRASGDYISQYHEETHAAYARQPAVDYEYRRDEYHRHWATSIEETFAFHLRAFANPSLDTRPEQFDYASAYANFSAWGWHVESSGAGAAVTYLEGVGQGGFRLATRAWAPDGLAVAGRKYEITTAPLYSPGAKYVVLDNLIEAGVTKRGEAAASADGRIRVSIDGGGHQVSFLGPGTGAQPPVLLPVTSGDVLRLAPGVEHSIPVRIYNPRGGAAGICADVGSTQFGELRLHGGLIGFPALLLEVGPTDPDAGLRKGGDAAHGQGEGGQVTFE